jgi:hypothetical protein
MDTASVVLITFACKCMAHRSGVFVWLCPVHLEQAAERGVARPNPPRVTRSVATS